MAKSKRNTPSGVVKVTDEARIASAASGPERRIIPLDGGRYAYVIDPVTSKNVHCKVDSDRFVELITAQAAHSEAYAERLHWELSSLTHGDIPAALAALEAAGVFSTAAV